MALADRVTQPPGNKQPGIPCSVGRLLDELPDSERDALQQMLGTPAKPSEWTQSAIFDALIAEGHRVGQSTINRHRGGYCRCEQR